MDRNDAALFTRIVASGSLSAAAAELGVQRSSVSRALSRLEDALGVRLLQRTTRKLVLTDAGQLFYERVRGAVAGFDDAVDAVREFGGEPRGTVRITAPPGTQQLGLAAALAAFTRKHPQIHVELTVSSRVVDLVGEGFDLAVRGGKLPDSSLIARKVGPSQGVLFAAPAYLARAGTPEAVPDLGRHVHLLYRSRTSKSLLRLHGPNGEETVEVRGSLSADDMSFLLHACIAGAGIALLPIELARAAVLDGRIARVLPRHYAPGGSVFVVLPSAVLVPARVALLRDHLVAHLERMFADAHKDCAGKESCPGPADSALKRTAERRPVASRMRRRAAKARAAS